MYGGKRCDFNIQGVQNKSIATIESVSQSIFRKC